MCIDDHLYKAVFDFVKLYGAYSQATCDLALCRKHISYNSMVSDETLKRMIGMANYILYDEDKV